MTKSEKAWGLFLEDDTCDGAKIFINKKDADECQLGKDDPLAYTMKPVTIIHDITGIPLNCPLPDYDWKEELLRFIDLISVTHVKNGRTIESLNSDDLKQKIKEM